MAFGDVGRGDPFCVHLDYKLHTVVCRSCIDIAPEEDLTWRDFCATWLGG
ncbi:MAG TPA: hypothetical protein VME20_12920 [Acidimicrobiales bacterium]|nr:hypothetical protein [Acidimicrobiales bacterium]